MGLELAMNQSQFAALDETNNLSEVIVQSMKHLKCCFVLSTKDINSGNVKTLTLCSQLQHYKKPGQKCTQGLHFTCAFSDNYSLIFSKDERDKDEVFSLCSSKLFTFIPLYGTSIPLNYSENDSSYLYCPELYQLKVSCF